MSGGTGDRYDVVLADPPWRYNARRSASSRFGLGVHGHYPTMSTVDICALPVADLAAPRSLLFLWVTWPRLEDGMAVMRAWGFRYVTVGFLWVKTNPKSGGVYFGTGYYAKANTEPCLLGTRGGAWKPATDSVSSVVMAPRRAHSQKPDDVRRRIVRMYPDVRRVELFARDRADGWDSWGNEVEPAPAVASALPLGGVA